jgi:DNA-binding transcriptional regulator YbjK
LPYDYETFETTAMHTSDNLTAVKSAIKRDQANVRAEQEGSLLSQQELANTVQDANLIELYRRLSDAEQRHASSWDKRLQAAGQPVSRAAFPTLDIHDGIYVSSWYTHANSRLMHCW